MLTYGYAKSFLHPSAMQLLFGDVCAMSCTGLSLGEGNRDQCLQHHSFLLPSLTSLDQFSRSPLVPFLPSFPAMDSTVAFVVPQGQILPLPLL